MQRKAIRATVGATDVDIPIHTFLNTQCLVYSDNAITTEVRVRVVGTPTTNNLASWFNQETIQDSGILASNIVTNPGTSVARQVAIFSDGTGKAIAAAPVKIDVAGALTLVTDINGRPVDTFVTGPASAGSDNLASYNGTTGKAIKDSGILSSFIVSTLSIDVVDGDVVVWSGITGTKVRTSHIAMTALVTSLSTPSANQVATFTGTGIAIQNTTVTISGGVITNVVSINGTAIGDYVTGPASAATNNLTSFNGTTGKVVKDSGIASSVVVQYNTTPGNPIVNELAGFDTTTSPYKVSWRPVRIDTSGNMTLVVNINGRAVDSFVSGPASAGNNNLVVFSGTTGKAVGDSAVVITNVPLCSVAGSADTIATFTGTGKTIQGTTVFIVSGDISGVDNIAVNTLNSVAVSNYMRTDGSTFDGNDVPSLGGGGFRPVSTVTGITNAQAVSTTSVEPSGFRVIGPGRSGNFTVTWDFALTLGDTSSGIEAKVFWTSGTGNAFCVFSGLATLLFTTSGTAASFTLGASSPSIMNGRCVLTVTGASSAVNCYMMFRKTGGIGFTIQEGGLLTFREED